MTVSLSIKTLKSAKLSKETSQFPSHQSSESHDTEKYVIKVNKEMQKNQLQMVKTPSMIDEINKNSKIFYNSYSIKIRDQGRGMDPEEIDNLFLNFRTLNQDGANPHGTGLGLGICRKILQKMGGIVKVKSKKGQGTVFKIELTSLCRQTKTNNTNLTEENLSSSSISFKSNQHEAQKLEYLANKKQQSTLP